MLEHMVLSTGKHGRVARGVALASDMTMREGRRCQRVGVMSKFFFFFFTTRTDAVQTPANSRRLGPYREKPADSSQNSKKKKNLSLSPQLSLSQFSSSALSHSLVSVLHATALWPLLSVSPFSHNITLNSLSHSHNLTLKSLNS